MGEHYKIPVVEMEKTISKTCKLIYVTGIIIVLIIMVGYYHTGNNFLIKSHQMIKINTKNQTKQNMSNEKISGNMIRVISVKFTPIQKIVIIDTDRNVIPLFTKDHVSKKLPDNRYIIEYNIKNPVTVSQIIIDIDTTDKKSLNIIHTKVEIVNNNTVSWVFEDTLSYQRYNTLYVCSPGKDNILKPDTFYKPLATEHEEEIKLLKSLQR
jgi:hypothetical protein